MMKTKLETYLRGGALTTAALIMMGCAAPHAVSGPHDVAVAGPVECFPESASAKTDQLAKFKGAVFIGLDDKGQISVGYPNKAFQATLDGYTTKAELAAAVTRATAADMVFFPTSQERPALPNPLDFQTASNVTVAFRLMPEAWQFMNAGFALKAKNIEKGRVSPFNVDMGSREGASDKLVIVDYDRESKTPEGKCLYQYELQAEILSVSKGLTSRLPIILDPGWGNGGKGSPP